MTKSRRRFLQTSSVALLTSAAAPFVAAQDTNPPPGAPSAFNTSPPVGPEVSAATFAEAKKLVQITLTAPQRAMTAANWRIKRRDDLSIELIGLLNQIGDDEEALRLLSSRSFRPWEGGEGLVLEQHVRTHIALGRQALLRNNDEIALEHFRAAFENPANLGEASHLLANRSNIYFWLGSAYQKLGLIEDAERWWRKAIASEGDFQEMAVQAFSGMSFYRALAFRQLRREQEREELLKQLRGHANDLERREPRIDYFATSLPNMLLFKENLRLRQHLQARFLEAQAMLGLGEIEDARRVLREILAEEPSHTAASDLLAESDCLGQLGLLRATAGRPEELRN